MSNTDNCYSDLYYHQLVLSVLKLYKWNNYMHSFMSLFNMFVRVIHVDVCSSNSFFTLCCISLYDYYNLSILMLMEI